MLNLFLNILLLLLKMQTSSLVREGVLINIKTLIDSKFIVTVQPHLSMSLRNLDNGSCSFAVCYFFYYSYSF